MKRNKKIVCKDVHKNEYEIPVDRLFFRPSVYGVIIEKGKILLSKQWGDGYDFPGGGVELGETIEEALIREVKEETGYNVKVKKFITVKDSFFKPGNEDIFMHSILIYFSCEVSGGEIGDLSLDAYEKEYVDKPEWIDLKDLRKVRFYNALESSIDIVRMAE